MHPLALPHQPPIRFAQSVIAKEKDGVRVGVAFPSLPSLGMFIEAAAQSCAGLEDESGSSKEGFLLALKGIKLHQKAKELSYEIVVKKEYELGSMHYISFKVYRCGSEEEMASGHLTVALAP